MSIDDIFCRFAMNETPLTGHCAFCLKELVKDAADVQRCRGCHKRVYCSEACRSADWLPNGGGQGHANWCNIQCGEEDVDWCVAPIPGKGLGLVAKRRLPALFRIMVEGPRSPDFPAVQDLMPQGGSLQDKYSLNGFGNDGGAPDRKSSCRERV